MVQISAENIGQVICLENTSNLIQIEDVTDKLVIYRNEFGHRHGTYERDFAGHLVLDPDRIRLFERNYEVGRALNAAEQSALNKYFAYRQDPGAKEEAEQALCCIHAQQEHLEKSIARNQVQSKEIVQEHENTEILRHDSLDSMIRNANAQKEETFAKGQRQTLPEREQQEQGNFCR